MNKCLYALTLVVMGTAMMYGEEGRRAAAVGTGDRAALFRSIISGGITEDKLDALKAYVGAGALSQVDARQILYHLAPLIFAMHRSYMADLLAPDYPTEATLAKARKLRSILQLAQTVASQGMVRLTRGYPWAELGLNYPVES